MALGFATLVTNSTCCPSMHLNCLKILSYIFSHPHPMIAHSPANSVWQIPTHLSGHITKCQPLGSLASPPQASESFLLFGLVHHTCDISLFKWYFSPLSLDLELLKGRDYDLVNLSFPSILHSFWVKIDIIKSLENKLVVKMMASKISNTTFPN